MGEELGRHESTVGEVDPKNFLPQHRAKFLRQMDLPLFEGTVERSAKRLPIPLCDSSVVCESHGYCDCVEFLGGL
jgi:hypothetical protein